MQVVLLVATVCYSTTLTTKQAELQQCIRAKLVPLLTTIASLTTTSLTHTTDANNRERVVVLCHQPLHPGTAGAVCLLWNYAVVLQLLWERPRGEVVACFAGHAHRGGYVQDTHGIHHQVLEAALEV
jgi:hypothetical protein